MTLSNEERRIVRELVTVYVTSDDPEHVQAVARDAVAVLPADRQDVVTVSTMQSLADLIRAFRGHPAIGHIIDHVIKGQALEWAREDDS